MKRLVEEMLTLARADDMVRPAVMEPVSLSDLAADCALSFEPVAFEAGKSLDYQLAEHLTILGEEDKLRRAISILLDNAIKYGAAGGTIRLTLEKTDRQARLTVSNPGEPIPAGPAAPPVRALLPGRRLSRGDFRLRLGPEHRRRHRPRTQGDPPGRERPDLHPLFPHPALKKMTQDERVSTACAREQRP